VLAVLDQPFGWNRVTIELAYCPTLYVFVLLKLIKIHLKVLMKVPVNFLRLVIKNSLSSAELYSLPDDLALGQFRRALPKTHFCSADGCGALYRVAQNSKPLQNDKKSY